MAWALAGALCLLALVSCSPANGDGPDAPTDPLALKPSVTTVRALDEGFTFEYVDDTSVMDLWWSMDVVYDATDVGAVFGHYQALFAELGFIEQSVTPRVGESSAVYSHGTSGVNAALRAKRDGNRVRVDLDFELLGSFPPPTPGFSLTDFQGMEVTFFEGADVIDLEWAFAFSHPSRGAEEVFAFYDAQLQAMGWTALDPTDGADAERESEYVLDGVYLAFVAGGDTWVEIEVNKLRFYQE